MPKIFKGTKKEEIFIKRNDHGCIVFCDEAGEGLKEKGTILLTQSGWRCGNVNPRLAEKANVTLDCDGKWDKDEAIQTLHCMLVLKSREEI